MLRWMFKSLVAEPLSMLLSISAAASAFLLVMVFEAVYEGESEQVVAYISNAGADVWVMQQGVANMHMATSYLGDWKLERMRTLPGVATAEGILYLNTVVKTAGQQWFAYVVGLDQTNTKAGPWLMASGSVEPGVGEAIVPQAFADTGGLSLGDSVRVVDRDFVIVGFSAGTFSIANSIIFVIKDDLEEIMSVHDLTSFGLVEAVPGVSASELSKQIETQIGGVNALPAAEFILNDRRMALQMGVETIALMTAIGAVLAALLIAFTIYSLIARQRRELAVAKALGVTNRMLYANVALQVVTITVASVLLATAMALAAMPLITLLVPTVTLKLTTAAVTRIGLAGVAVGLVSSVLPARQIASVDPMSAFQT